MGYVSRNYSTTSDTSHSLTVDVGSNAGRAIAVMAYSGAGFTLSTLTIDGVGVSTLASGTDGSGNLYYVAAAVVSGTGTITVTAAWSGAGSTKRLHLMSFDGVDSVRGGAVAHASSTTPSVTVTTVDGDMVSLQGNDGAFGRTFSAASPATLTSATGSNFDAYETATGASTTIDGTLNGSASWYAGAIAFQQAAGGGGGGTLPPIINHYHRRRA